jgi:hypothetical protein
MISPSMTNPPHPSGTGQLGQSPLGEISLQINDSMISPTFQYPPGEEAQRLISVVRRTTVGSTPTGPGGHVGIGIKFYPNKLGDHVITSLQPGGSAEQTHQSKCLDSHGSSTPRVFS